MEQSQQVETTNAQKLMGTLIECRPDFANEQLISEWKAFVRILFNVYKSEAGNLKQSLNDTDSNDRPPVLNRKLVSSVRQAEAIQRTKKNKPQIIDDKCDGCLSSEATIKDLMDLKNPTEIYMYLKNLGYRTDDEQAKILKEIITKTFGGITDYTSKNDLSRELFEIMKRK